MHHIRLRRANADTVLEVEKQGYAPSPILIMGKSDLTASGAKGRSESCSRRCQFQPEKKAASMYAYVPNHLCSHTRRWKTILENLGNNGSDEFCSGSCIPPKQCTTPDSSRTQRQNSLSLTRIAVKAISSLSSMLPGEGHTTSVTSLSI